MDEDQFKQLKREVEEAKSEADKAEGALIQLLNRLESEFECGNVKEGKALLADLGNRLDKAEKNFQDALKTYEKKWKQNEE